MSFSTQMTAAKYRVNGIHSFYFIRTLRLRFAPNFKKMYGLKLEHPQAQPNYTCSYMKKKKERESVNGLKDLKVPM